jgi:hypothetical protein
MELGDRIIGRKGKRGSFRFRIPTKEMQEKDKDGVPHPQVSHREMNMDLVTMIVMDDHPLNFGNSKMFRRLVEPQLEGATRENGDKAVYTAVGGD